MDSLIDGRYSPYPGRESVERRLAAILAADVVGYSRLMGEDEAGTLAALQNHRENLIEPKAAQYHGRTVKLIGDGALMEFGSVVDAVAFAVEVQIATRQRNSGVPKNRQIVLRIGINLGDIILQDEDIYGDGVNVAARLEGLAEPGGICLSRAARDQVRDKLDLRLEDLGEVEVKNISRPVRAFRVILDSKATALVTPIVRQTVKTERLSRPLAIAAVVVLFLAAGGAFWWQPWSPDVEPASVERMAFPLPDRPSIAVLPFDNLSGDAEQNYFADGITEDLITDLSKISGLFVIARNSSFSYKGQPVEVRRVAEELGVRYVLEGSVRRAGDQVRINAQLIDTTTGGHLWAERYDSTLANVFALQDQVTQKIVSALSVTLAAGEQAQRTRSETASQEAYDAFLRGWAYYRRNTPEAFAAAIPYFKQALSLDPGYSRAHAALAAIYWQAAEEKESTGHPGLWLGALGISYEVIRQRGNEHLKEALKNPTPLAHQAASGLRSRQGRHEESIAEAEHAVEIDPNNPVGYEALAKALIYAGRPSEGARVIRKAMRIDPHFPASYLGWLGIAQFNQESYADAAATFRTVLQRNPDEDTALIVLTAALGHLDEPQQAESAYSMLNDLRQKREVFFEQQTEGIEAGVDSLLIGPYTLKDVDFWPFKEISDRERLRRGLELAGVPDRSDISVSPTSVDGTRTVDATAAKELFDQGVMFVDVRTLELWKLGHIPGAKLLDLKTDFTEEKLSAIVDRNESLVIYCEGPKCLRSSQACAQAVSWNFSQVYYYRDGFPSWRSQGYPIASE
jgi:TolB-like protein/class 3 adenylate cyclase/rhodanese-related sulfurtransferase